jgi:hypothetical protein
MVHQVVRISLGHGSSIYGKLVVIIEVMFHVWLCCIFRVATVDTTVNKPCKSLTSLPFNINGSSVMSIASVFARGYDDILHFLPTLLLQNVQLSNNIHEVPRLFQAIRGRIFQGHRSRRRYGV